MTFGYRHYLWQNVHGKASGSYVTRRFHPTWINFMKDTIDHPVYRISDASNAKYLDDCCNRRLKDEYNAHVDGHEIVFPSEGVAVEWMLKWS